MLVTVNILFKRGLISRRCGELSRQSKHLELIAFTLTRTDATGMGVAGPSLSRGDHKMTAGLCSLRALQAECQCRFCEPLLWRKPLLTPAPITARV